MAKKEKKQEYVVEFVQPQDEVLDKEKELMEAKETLAQAQNEVQDLKVSIELAEDYDEKYDMYSVPKEIQQAYPDMNFHWVSITPEAMSKAMVYRYQVVHIPKSCKDLLALHSMTPKPGITNAFGDDVMVRGISNILMMCPKQSYLRRKSKMHDRGRVKSKADIKKEEDALMSLIPSGGIKEASIIHKRE